MRRTDLRCRLRHAVRLGAGLVISLTLIAVTVPAAHADPSTNERRKVAEEVAVSVCTSVPSIPKLPPSVNPKKLCQSVIVENVDPEGNNKGVLAACLIALPVAAKPAAKFCAQVLDKLLDPARQLFLDKVVPVAQQLACVTSTPAAFDCLAQQVHVWLKQSIVALWQGLITTLTNDTKAISLLDGWRNGGIVSLYSDIGAVGATLLLGLMITSLIISAIRFDFRRFGKTLLGVAVWGIFWSGGMVIAVLLLKASDDASRWLSGTPDANGETDLIRAGKEFASWVDYISGATAAAAVHPLYNPGSFSAMFVCLFLIVAIVITLFALLMRTIALLMIMVMLPWTLAGSVGPKMTQEWFSSAVRMFLALLLAKPLIVIAVRLGAVLVSVPQEGEPQATFSDAMLGVAIILLAGLLPGVIYKFSGGLMSTSSGSAPRAQGGVVSQSSQSIQSSADMTRMVMERNAPAKTLAAGSPGSAGAARSGATRAGAGVGGAGVGGAGLGAAAGPLGVAALGAAMAGGTLESGGRWLGGQAATGGGVLGDVEAPAVPSPPVTRVPYSSGSRQGSTAQPAPGTGRAGAATSPPSHISIVQTQPSAPTRTALPPAAPHLIIPGTVVPDEAPKQLSKGQRALPSKDHPHD